MDVGCPKCQTEYELDDARVTEDGVTVKCTTCGHVFRVKKKQLVVTLPLARRADAPPINLASGTAPELPRRAPQPRVEAAPALGERLPLPRSDDAPEVDHRGQGLARRRDLAVG